MQEEFNLPNERTAQPMTKKIFKKKKTLKVEKPIHKMILRKKI
jgi:hypothetical protein